MVLEMTFAPARPFRPLYGVYLRRILPALARLFARDVRTYYYLGDSIRHFPAPRALHDLMREAGLGPVTYRSLTFGTAYLHIGRVRRGD
jgi:demethylmenaquinone methyltransferase / 2-methoxy-6-polyprenyl-1,4-benzoquinol methylase